MCLEEISSENLAISTFGTPETLNKKASIVQVTIADLKQQKHMEINAFSVPYICARLKNQPVQIALATYDHLNGLELAETGEGTGQVDILIWSDFYWVRLVVR